MKSKSFFDDVLMFLNNYVELSVQERRDISRFAAKRLEEWKKHETRVVVKSVYKCLLDLSVGDESKRYLADISQKLRRDI